MNKNRKSRMDIKSPDLPPLESFSFQDILASIDPEVKVSIDAIAEICSRSKLSLADEYGSHLPPQAQFIAPYGQGQNCGATPTHLDTLHESPSMDLQVPVNQEHDQRNSVSLALITTANQRSAAMSSAPTAVTSMVHSEPLMEFSSHEPTRASNAESDLQSSTLPHVLAWLRRSSASLTGLNDLSHLDDRDASAVDTLNRILAKSKGTLEPAT